LRSRHVFRNVAPIIALIADEIGICKSG